MTDLNYLQSVVLGAVQGLTEFLPVSSSAHLALAQRLLGLNPSGQVILLFDMLMHVGTMAAMGVVFGRTLLHYLQRVRSEASPAWIGPRPAWRFLLLGVVATIPTGVIGLAFQDFFEHSFDRPRQIGVELAATGVLLALTIRLPKGKRGWRSFRVHHGLLIGLAQGLAILPGVSRSGATICVATYCGLRRRWAGDFSFLIAAPAILGATMLKLKDVLAIPSEQLAAIPWGPMVIGSVVSLAVGVIALQWLLTVVRRSQLHCFAPYCVILGVLAVAGAFSTGHGASAAP